MNTTVKTTINLKHGLDHPVKLEQRESGEFRVTYGGQVKDNLTYAEAAKEFGECTFHSLACMGAIDNN